MSENEIEYYKIKWCLRRRWKLMDAAYLLAGFDPSKKSELSQACQIKADRLHDKLYQSVKEGKIHVMHLTIKQRHRTYDPIQVVECAKKQKYAFDNDIADILAKIDGRKIKEQQEGRVKKAIFREAGRLVWKRHNSFRKGDVAKILEILPEKLGDMYPIALKHENPSTIQAYLRGYGPHGAGAPAKMDGAKEVMSQADWDYIVKKMSKKSVRK